MPKPVLTVLGQNITDFLIGGLPVIEEQQEFNFDKLISNTFSFVVNNESGKFGLNNAASLFQGNSWMNSEVKCWGWKGNQIWEGVLIDVVPNYQMSPPQTTLTTKMSLFNVKDELIEYESSDWETPANSFQNICDAISFTDYDTTSLQTSINAFTAAGCEWKMNINKSEGQKFQNLVEKIAEYSNTIVYGHLNKLYFQHWTPYTQGANIELLEKDLITKPVIKSHRGTFFNQYNIGYIGGVATDSTLGAVSRNRYKTKEFPQMSTGATSEQIYFKDLTSAQYIGESIIKRGHKTLTTNPTMLSEYTAQIDYEYREFIRVGLLIKQTFAPEEWVSKIFEVINFSIDENTRTIQAVLLEVDV
jgi:hypothetical protein